MKKLILNLVIYFCIHSSKLIKYFNRIQFIMYIKKEFLIINELIFLFHNI